MSNRPEPELTYMGRSHSFVGARCATTCFDENKLIPKDTTAPTCACCKRQQRGPWFVAAMELSVGPATQA
eukprot:12927985-Prorocentrum_lima.AAC.1